MNNLSSQTNLLTVLKKRKVIIGAAVLFLFLIGGILFSGLSQDKQTISQNPQITNSSVTPSPQETKPANDIRNSEIIISGDPMKDGWKQVTFSENNLNGIDYKKTTLSNGEIQYIIPSVNQNRPNEIVTNGKTIISQRALISQKMLSDYTAKLGQPEYTFQGSSYYGNDTLVYVYLNRGLALFAGPRTTLVYEQLTFPPMTFAQFKQQYGKDIIDFTVIPTLPDEESIRPEDSDNGQN